MMNAVNTTQRMRRKERHKFSRTMAVILGLIVTLEVMVAGETSGSDDEYHERGKTCR